MIGPRNETEYLLLSITKNCETLGKLVSEETRRNIRI